MFRNSGELGYRAFWKSSYNTYAIWNLNPRGQFTQGIAVSKAQIFNLERDQQYDLDGNGQVNSESFVGSGVIIRGTEFGTTSSGFAFKANGQVNLITHGGNVTSYKFPGKGWMIRAVWPLVDGKGYRVFWKNLNNDFVIWDLNLNGVANRGDKLSLVEVLNMENAQQFDLDGNGLIGKGAGWIQSEGRGCSNVCARYGMSLTRDRGGNSCASGEVRPAGVPGRFYVHRIWGNGATGTGGMEASGYCYKKGQKRDQDQTDLTVACFCQRN